MPPPQLPTDDSDRNGAVSIVSAPTPGSRRHLRQESAEEVERRERQDHILQLQERLEQRKRDEEEEKDLGRRLEQETGVYRKQFA